MEKYKGQLQTALVSAVVALAVTLLILAWTPVTVPTGDATGIGARGLQPIQFTNPVTFRRIVTFDQAQTFTGAATFNGLVNADAGIAVDTNKFTVADGSGNTVIAGTLNVTGATTHTGAVTVNNNATVTGTLNVSGSGITGTLLTAAQPNVTSFGAVPTATITNLNATTVTGTLATANQPNVTNLGTQGYLTVTNPISMGGATFTGASRAGSLTNAITGTLFAHGLNITPTLAIVVPMYAPGTTYTQTLFAFGCNTISCTVGISVGDVITFTNAAWSAIK